MRLPRKVLKSASVSTDIDPPSHLSRGSRSQRPRTFNNYDTRKEEIWGQVFYVVTFETGGDSTEMFVFLDLSFVLLLSSQNSECATIAS